MALSKPLCGILSVGIRKERAAHDFYVHAAGNTKHPLGKKMFDRLAGEEAKHEELLKGWSAGGACPTGARFPAPDSDLLKRGHAKVEKIVRPATGDLEAIEIGRTMEREAIRFYADGAAKADDRASKDLLLRLRAEEDKHLALLTDLYEYMRDPNLWSVRDEKAHFDS
jgi:rubrerythrin